MLQPLVGLYTDRRPQPYSLTVGIGLTLIGLLLMSRASTYAAILLAAMLIGMGSSIFHPEASRVARMAAGGRYGLAQSLFQVGGNIGSASGPLLAAFVVVPHGQSSIAWFSAAALIAIFVLLLVGNWYAKNRPPVRRGPRPPALISAAAPSRPMLPRRKVIQAVAILVALLFSKNVYSASLGSYYTFFLIDKFHLPVQTAQFYLFAFLTGIVAGTLAGGAVGDRVGRIPVMWFSILGALPFALLLPYANLFWTGVLAVLIAMIMASAFSAILVYAQELLPGRVGLAAGMFYRLLVRPGWSRGSRPREARRPHQHHHDLPPVSAPAAAWAPDRLPASPARRALADVNGTRLGYASCRRGWWRPTYRDPGTS